MADNKNNKIFSEEDFDKPSQKGNWFSEHIKQILLSALAIVCIILAIIFIPRGCTEGTSSGGDSIKVDTLSKDTVTTVIVEDTTNADSTTTNPEVVDEATDDNSGTQIEADKTEEEKPATPDPVTVSEDVVKEALSVIRGNYGNNPDRRCLLKERYQEIQNKVNEMYRNGQVK